MKVIRWLDEHLEEFLLGFLLCAMATILMIQVIMRYCFKSPLLWSEEAARYCFVVAAFVSLGYCVRRDVIIKVDVISKMFPQKIQKVLELVMWISMLLLFCWLAWNCRTVVAQAVKAQRTSTALHIPMQYIYSIPQVGFVWMIFRILQRMYRQYLKKSM